METITTMSDALTFISKIESIHPKADVIKISFEHIPLFEMEQLSKQENLEIKEQQGILGMFFWRGKNCYAFWNEIRKEKKYGKDNRRNAKSIKRYTT